MLRRFSLVLTFVFVIAVSGAAAEQAKQEYFTEGELDLIRDAQELTARVPAYFDLAERRLIILGVAEKSDKQKERERKSQEKYDKDVKKAGPKAGTIKKPENELEYLYDFTRAELLRGYMQALDEVMDNIDDQYSRKLDVRNALEDLEKFTRESLPQLEKFQPKSQSERTVLEEAIEKNKQANDGAKEAMKKVPKTEKKPTKPPNGL
jgi:hypothetical protein